MITQVQHPYPPVKGKRAGSLAFRNSLLDTETHKNNNPRGVTQRK